MVISALVAGFTLNSEPVRQSPHGKSLGLLGKGLITVVVLQFVLGWVTFGFGGTGVQAQSTLQALIRTAHQANGAFLLALATAAFIWGRRLSPKASKNTVAKA